MRSRSGIGTPRGPLLPPSSRCRESPLEQNRARRARGSQFSRSEGEPVLAEWVRPSPRSSPFVAPVRLKSMRDRFSLCDLAQGLTLRLKSMRQAKHQPAVASTWRPHWRTKQLREDRLPELATGYDAERRVQGLFRQCGVRGTNVMGVRDRCCKCPAIRATHPTQPALGRHLGGESGLPPRRSSAECEAGD